MKVKLRKTNIVGTIGPASESEEVFRKLVEAGLNIARINFSHGGYDENASKIEMIKKVREELNQPVGLMLDTKGPEIRTGKLETGNEKVTINEGQMFSFTYDDIIGNETRASISYKNLYAEITPGTKILVDDGALEFEVTEIVERDIVCRALNTGKLGSRKTVNVPGLKLNLPALSQKDIDDITKGINAEFDFIAASFVRRASDVKEIRALLDANGGEDIQIISKIESQEGIDNFEEILQISDGIMIARGDMGVEIPLEQVPVIQKHFIRRCNEVGKPVITATQMLESMQNNPRPTRAEVSDVANAVYDRTSCIMLSGECAAGKYPIICVETMDRICKNIEEIIHYWKRFKQRTFEKSEDFAKNIVYATGRTAEHIKADAIVAYTHTGNTARTLSGTGVPCPILAITDCHKTYEQLSIVWNVTPILVEGGTTIEDTVSRGMELLKEKGVLEQGDTVILSGGAKVLYNEKEFQAVSAVVKI